MTDKDSFVSFIVLVDSLLLNHAEIHSETCRLCSREETCADRVLAELKKLKAKAMESDDLDWTEEKFQKLADFFNETIKKQWDNDEN